MELYTAGSTSPQAPYASRNLEAVHGPPGETFTRRPNPSPNETPLRSAYYMSCHPPTAFPRSLQIPRTPLSLMLLPLFRPSFAACSSISCTT